MQGLVENLLDVGFTRQHLTLILLCAASGALGSLIRVLLTYWEGLQRLPRREPTRLPWASGLNRLLWIFSRLLVGAVLGGFVGVYFTGALADGVSVVARVLIIAALFGYLPPEETLKRLEKRFDSQESSPGKT